MILSYLSHSFSKTFCVFGEVSLSSNSNFLCVGASTGDFRKLSFFFMNGFSNSSVIFSCLFRSGIQFLRSSFSSSSMVEISNTLPSLQSFSAKATTWSFGRCRYSWWLKFTMTNGVTVSGFLSLRSAIIGYVHMLGFELSQSSFGMTLTLTSSVLLMSMSTTAQECGGVFAFLLCDTVALDAD